MVCFLDLPLDSKNVRMWSILSLSVFHSKRTIFFMDNIYTLMPSYPRFKEVAHRPTSTLPVFHLLKAQARAWTMKKSIRRRFYVSFLYIFLSPLSSVSLSWRKIQDLCICPHYNSGVALTIESTRWWGGGLIPLFRGVRGWDLAPNLSPPARLQQNCAPLARGFEVFLSYLHLLTGILSST